MAAGRTALVPGVRLANAHQGDDRARRRPWRLAQGAPQHAKVLPKGIGDDMRLDAPEPAAHRQVTGYLSEAHVVESDAALPSAAHVVACVVAAAEVGIMTEEGAHGGAAGLGHVPVNHSPTPRGGGRVHHRCL